ncbi:hypothetical protein E2562_001975 [Oryza meyeriana var. granulata]|uniref:PB1-like domain-containing protein n=1 Tax=Oryza meyeriana var. granulata TaxID=110450 RepID=A0A6G1C3D9_9ORYZ|nr:hypothetical protein E2562_001975 [Oryza meyeriana var. granulata]
MPLHIRPASKVVHIRPGCKTVRVRPAGHDLPSPPRSGLTYFDKLVFADKLVDFSRFHFNGEFIHDGRVLHYCGGFEGISHIDRDKVSLPEVMGHLGDYCEVEDGMLLHWLFLGKELASGLRVLLDDKVCQLMSDCAGEGEVADIYVDTPVAEEDSSEEDLGSADGNDFEDEPIEIYSDEDADEITEVDIKGKNSTMRITSTPEKTQRDIEALR